MTNKWNNFFFLAEIEKKNEKKMKPNWKKNEINEICQKKWKKMKKNEINDDYAACI